MSHEHYPGQGEEPETESVQHDIGYDRPVDPDTVRRMAALNAATQFALHVVSGDTEGPSKAERERVRALVEETKARIRNQAGDQSRSA